jgi:hypothetical protein
MSKVSEVRQTPVLIIGGGGEVSWWATRFLQEFNHAVPSSSAVKMSNVLVWLLRLTSMDLSAKLVTAPLLSSGGMCSAAVQRR